MNDLFRRMKSPMAFCLIFLLALLPPAPVLGAPHSSETLLAKLPPLVAQSDFAWPQGVESVSHLFHTEGSEAGRLRALSAYDVVSDTADPYITALDTFLPQAEVVSPIEPGDWYVLRVEENAAADVLSALLADPAVLAAEPDYPISAGAFTAGELRAAELAQYHLDSYGIPQGLSQVSAPGLGVRVAVLDSGTDITHPDLVANIDTSYTGPRNFIPGKNSSDVTDGYGHGTMVAGLIAANGQARGVAPLAKIIPIKVLDENGMGSTSNLTAAINAVKGSADIINLSLGATAPSAALNEAILSAWQSNCLVVSSAGNDGLPNAPVDGTGVYAAVYPAASIGAIGVMAATGTPAAGGDVLAPFSNWDVTPDDRVEYHVMAPGTSLQSTAAGGGYRTGNGTSFAAPVVSGMAAVLLSALREASPGAQITNADLFTRVAGSGETVRGKTVGDRIYLLRQARLDNMLNILPSTKVIIDQDSLTGELTAGSEPNQLALEVFALRGTLANATLRLTSQTPNVRFDGGASAISINLGALPANTRKTAPFSVYVSESVPNGTEAVFSVSLASGGVSSLSLRKTVSRRAHIGGDILAGHNALTLDSSSAWTIDSPVYIPAGKTLTIAAGTDVTFGAALTNAGTLKIEGTAERPVTLHPTDSENGRVTIENSATAARATLSYVKITNPDLKVSSIDHAYWSGRGTAARPLHVEAGTVSYSQASDFYHAVIKGHIDRSSFSYMADVSIGGGNISNCTFMNNVLPSESSAALTGIDLAGVPAFTRNAVLTPLRFVGTAGSAYDLRGNYFDLTHSVQAQASDFGLYDTLGELAPGIRITADAEPQPSLTADCPPFILYASGLPADARVAGYHTNRLLLTFNTDMAPSPQSVLELLHRQGASLTPAFFYNRRAVSGEWIGPRTWRLDAQTFYSSAFVSAAGLRWAKDEWLCTPDGERRLN
ncbi:MAG: S8 family serine peptidase, partial [Gracilibacteraceae bacterium]|nr:S8 family serine peptidase [Gracilibacteraceae bacterium]